MAKSLYYTEIMFYKAWAELKAECGRTWGGALWWFVDPLLSILVYYIAFGIILQRGSAGFVSFLCVGIIVWRWFQCSVMRGATSIISESSLMAKVYMPKILFPAISILADLFKFCIMLALLLVFLWVSGIPPGITYIALPVVLLVHLMFIAAVVGGFAALVPFVPDLRHMLTHGLHLLFFLSGVFFSIERLSPPMRRLVLLNPMAGMIAAYRRILIDNQWPDWYYLSAVYFGSMIAVCVVARLLNRFDRLYPKVC